MDETISSENAGAKVKHGFVYLISNAWIRDPEAQQDSIVKIGSAVDFDKRLGSLNSAAPADFIIHMLVETDDCRGLENFIHNSKYFKVLRIRKSEFFRCSVKAAKDQIRILAKDHYKTCRNKMKDMPSCGKEIHEPNFIFKVAQLGRSGSAAKRNREMLFSGKKRFVCKTKFGLAYGYYKSANEFVVEANSVISRTCTQSFPHSEPKAYYEAWVKILKSEVDSSGKVKNAQTFKSRAFAASVVCGGIKNGNKEWREVEHPERTLGEYFGV